MRSNYDLDTIDINTVQEDEAVDVEYLLRALDPDVVVSQLLTSKQTSVSLQNWPFIRNVLSPQLDWVVQN